MRAPDILISIKSSAIRRLHISKKLKQGTYRVIRALIHKSNLRSEVNLNEGGLNYDYEKRLSSSIPLCKGVEVEKPGFVQQEYWLVPPVFSVYEIL